jgi:O-antigen ligase
MLALGLPVAWHLAVSEDNGKKTRVLKLVNFVYTPAATLAILLTASRTALLAALPAFLFVVGSLTRLNLFLRALILGALMAGFFALQPLVPQSSLQRIATTGTSIAAGDMGGRVYIWREGIVVFSEHPLLGTGSGAFRTAVEAGKVAHNSFLSILVDVGIVGFILFVIILAVTVYQAIRQPKWNSRLWLAVLLVWAIGASTLTWERKKPTWLFLSLVIVSAGLSTQRDETILRSKSPVRLKDLLKGETDEANYAIPSANRVGLGNANDDNGLPFRYGTGRGSQHLLDR